MLTPESSAVGGLSIMQGGLATACECSASGRFFFGAITYRSVWLFHLCPAIN
jgi:hypothetical protein